MVFHPLFSRHGTKNILHKDLMLNQFLILSSITVVLAILYNIPAPINCLNIILNYTHISAFIYLSSKYPYLCEDLVSPFIRLETSPSPSWSETLWGISRLSNSVSMDHAAPLLLLHPPTHLDTYLQMPPDQQNNRSEHSHVHVQTETDFLEWWPKYQNITIESNVYVTHMSRYCQEEK